MDAAGAPVEGARVRIRASDQFVLTGADGRFTLADRLATTGGEITAARPGHIVGGTTLKDGVHDYRIVVTSPPDGDDATYPWVTAFPENDEAPRTDFGREPCGACHRRILAEWQQSAHAGAAGNQRFLAFLGGNHALAFKQDINACGTCHLPMAPGADPRHVAGVAAEGIGCDLCHKIADARAGDGERAGIRAVDFRRPPFGRQAIFGPFDDVPRGRDVFSPVFSESRFCAACHQQRVGDVAVYSEFEEWQASRHPAAGTTCQSCHMRGDGKATTMADLGPGRIERAAATLSSHRFHDARSRDFIDAAIGLSLDTRIEGGEIVADVAVANLGAGHRLPAGSPMRHMLLVLTADAGDRPLALADGPTLPGWSGDALAGKPGRGFAKLLADGTGRSPATPWQATRLVEDTRIAPDASDRSRYRFRLEGTEPIRIEARLLIRRTFAGWAVPAGTDTGEIVAARRAIIVRH